MNGLYDRRGRVEPAPRRRAGLPGLLASVTLLMMTCGATSTEGSADAPAPAVVAAVAPNPADVLRWCGEEQAGTRQLASQLQHRERELDERAQTIAAREVELAAAQERLDARMTELAALRQELANELDQADTAQDERIQSVVKMVETNRASAIAPMVAELDPALAAKVLDRMSRQKAGKLLAALPPAQAAGLAERMTRPVTLVPR